MSDAALERFAERAGLEVHWTDIAGRAHSVAPDVLRAALNALGYDVGSDHEIADSERRLALESDNPPGLITAWTGEDFTIAGQMRRTPDQPGYHQLEIGGKIITLAAAPRRCFTTDAAGDNRLAGLAVQLYGLRGGTTRGFGDFSALAEFSSRAAGYGIDAIAISPVHALYSADPSHSSPYSPSSRIFLNPLYSDLSSYSGAGNGDDAAGGFVDWPAAAAEKHARLRAAFDGFDPHDSDGFLSFCQQGGERLLRHGLFEILDAYFRKQNISRWRDWSQAYRNPGSPEVLRFAVGHKRELEFQLFLQYVAAESAHRAQQRALGAGMRIGIIADIATGVDPNGSDCWGAPDEVLSGLHIGAPPDLFNTAGQDWGITALSPVQLRRTGFSTFIALLRANMGFAGGVRIDHAMGLLRLWVIPEGANPADGVYLRYPFADLLRLICLESDKARAIVIGEDLGTVPEGFSQTLAYRGISGMEVLWFEQERDGRFILPSRWRRDAVALTTTHDLPTVAGWWTGRDIDWRAEAGIRALNGDEPAERDERIVSKGKLWSALEDAHCVTPGAEPTDPQAVVDGALTYIARTPSRLAIAPVEDICGLREQPNLPGTINQHPNWRRRLPAGDFFALPSVGNRLTRFVAARRS